MYNVMKAQKYQLIRDNVTYIIFFCGLIFLWITYLMGAESGRSLSDMKGSGVVFSGGLSDIPIFLMLVYTTRICGDDLKDKTINYEVLTGKKRRNSYFGRLFFSVIVGAIVYILFTVLPVCIITSVYGWGHTLPLNEGIMRTALGFIPVIRMICFFAAITFITRSYLGAVALGFLTILIESLIVMISDEGLLPFSIKNLSPFLSMASSSVIEKYNMKLDYIDGENVQVLKDIMPAGTICMIVLTGLAACVMFSVAGYAVFKKKDMD